MTEKTATLGVEGTNHQFMLLDGTVGPEVIDIRKLYGETGMFTYDPGFTSTASCKSAITYIDGEAGILLHRGYPIDQLAENSTFMEVAYLLLHAELPTRRSWTSSSTRSAATPWSTSSSRPFTGASAGMPTRWRCCAAWSAPSPLFITTARTSPTPSSG